MKVSEFMIKKLIENGEEVELTLLNGDTCFFTLGGSNFFLCEKLPGQYVRFEIFDIVYDFLKKHNGKAPKVFISMTYLSGLNMFVPYTPLSKSKLYSLAKILLSIVTLKSLSFLS